MPEAVKAGEPDGEFLEMFKDMTPAFARAAVEQLVKLDLSELQPVNEEARERAYRAQAMAKCMLSRLNREEGLEGED